MEKGLQIGLKCILRGIYFLKKIGGEPRTPNQLNCAVCEIIIGPRR